MTSIEVLWNGWRANYVGAERDAGASVFTQIFTSGLPDTDTYIVHRSSTCCAIMNAYPYAAGHLLVVPYREVPSLIELTDDPAHGMSRVACVVDARGGQFFDSARDAILDLADSADVTVVFLDAADDVLVRRFEQVRRVRHPSGVQKTLTFATRLTAPRSDSMLCGLFLIRSDGNTYITCGDHS